MVAAAIQPAPHARRELSLTPGAHLCTPLQANAAATPYGNALVEVAQKTNSLEAVHADVDALAAILKENEVGAAPGVGQRGRSKGGGCWPLPRSAAAPGSRPAPCVRLVAPPAPSLRPLHRQAGMRGRH